MRDGLRCWRQAGPAGSAGDPQRWVVLDVESSGLDPKRDRLLAMAAIGVQVGPGRAAMVLADSFEVVLRQPGDSAADKANILLHGIGLGAQQGGLPPAQALAAFEHFVVGAPLLAFHAAFDRALVDRACRSHLGRASRHAWLDLEPLAAVLHPQVRARTLDAWLQHFGIVCARRHQAAADTQATAELLLRLWPAVCRELPRPDFKAVSSLAARRRWLAAP